MVTGKGKSIDTYDENKLWFRAIVSWPQVDNSGYRYPMDVLGPNRHRAYRLAQESIADGAKILRFHKMGTKEGYAQLFGLDGADFELDDRVELTDAGMRAIRYEEIEG